MFSRFGSDKPCPRNVTAALCVHVSGLHRETTTSRSPPMRRARGLLRSPRPALRLPAPSLLPPAPTAAPRAPAAPPVPPTEHLDAIAAAEAKQKKLWGKLKGAALASSAASFCFVPELHQTLQDLNILKCFSYSLLVLLEYLLVNLNSCKLLYQNSLLNHLKYHYQKNLIN